MALEIGDLSPGQTHFWEGIWQWQPLWLRPDEVIEAVTTAFGRTAADAKYLASGMLNQSWRLDDKYVLRVSRPERIRTHVQYEHDVIGALHEHLDIVVAALAAQNGETVVEWNGYVLSLFPFVDGISGTEVDKATRTRESAATLAHIHRISRDLVHLGQRPGSQMFDEGDRWPWLEQKSVLDKGFAGNSEAEQLIALIDTEYAELGRWVDELKSRQLPRAVCKVISTRGTSSSPAERSWP